MVKIICDYCGERIDTKIGIDGNELRVQVGVFDLHPECQQPWTTKVTKINGPRPQPEVTP